MSLYQGRFTKVITPHPISGASDVASSISSYLQGSDKEQPAGKGPRTSKLHYLIPASSSNARLCYNVVSSVAARYPAPILLGWKGEGELDAAKTHLAKLRAIKRYLHKVTKKGGKNDDDLVLIVDGYDIIMQLPPEIMIERYFNIVAESDARLAGQLGLTVDEAHKKGYRNTIFWGPDKICWPIEMNTARCWAVPNSTLGDKAFGPKTGEDGMDYNDPRWLNSGTVIAPLGDLRDYIDATMVEIKKTYDPNYENKESDQYYLANIWGRQEYYRTLDADKLKKEKEENEKKEKEEKEKKEKEKEEKEKEEKEKEEKEKEEKEKEQKEKEEKDKKKRGHESIARREEDRILPLKTSKKQKTEYHIAIEYESALFQTKAGYERFYGFMNFDQPGYAARSDVDMFELGSDFVPFHISMPANVHNAFTKIFECIPESRLKDGIQDAGGWIRSLPLGVNYVTRHIYGLWHCTGAKEPIAEEYPKQWFMPYVRSLLRGAVAASRKHDLISSVLIDGRLWAPQTYYPAMDVAAENGTIADDGQYGGAWSDYKGDSFVTWNDLCGENEAELLAGEEE